MSTKISQLTSGGAIQAGDEVPIVRSGANYQVNAGTAAAKAASDNSKATVASVSGTPTAGHLAVFADVSGTIVDGGAIPSGGGSGITALTGDVTAGSNGVATVVKINGQTPATVATTGSYNDLSNRPTSGTASAKAASDNTKATLASVPATVTAGHLATFADSSGTLQDGGAPPAALPPNGTAGGDLSGSYPNPTVAKLNGVAASSYVQSGSPQAYTAQQNFAQAALTDAATVAWNLNAQQRAAVTLGGNRTLAFPTNLPAGGGNYELWVRQDATGSRTLAFASGYKFPGGIAPVLSTGANAVDILSFSSDGTVMSGVAQLSFA